jgi:hypothetical protein
MSSVHGEGRDPGPRGPGHSGDLAERPVSALPSVRARVLAFAAILVAGLCGALIGYGFAGVQCTTSCTTKEGVGAVIGATLAAAGVAVIAVLTLRAMSEWRTIKEDRARAEAAEAKGNPGGASAAGTGPDAG